jgi:hypothetical protein
MIAAGWVALAVSFVAVLSLISLVLLFTVGGPFGLLNDAGNALIGCLSLVLAMLLVNQAGGWSGVAAVGIGAALTVWGSWLVMTGATGFALAGFVSTVGFGCIGAWLALVAWSPVAGEWFGAFLGLARIAAVALIVGGLAAIPAALMRIDAYDAMPPWLWLFSVGWISVYILYPIVSYGLGRRLLGA